MNPDADFAYQTVNLFSSDKCFICFICNCPHYIWWNSITTAKYEHIIAPHVSSASIFTRIVLDTCGAICSYFGIVFMLLFKKIESAVYTCFRNSMLLFINRFIFDIINIQNNHSLEFEWVPMLAPFIRSVNNWRFPWLRNVFVKSFQDWKLKLPLKLSNFFFDIRLSMYWRNALVKMLLKTVLVGKDL